MHISFLIRHTDRQIASSLYCVCILSFLLAGTEILCPKLNACTPAKQMCMLSPDLSMATTIDAFTERLLQSAEGPADAQDIGLRPGLYTGLQENNPYGHSFSFASRAQLSQRRDTTEGDEAESDSSDTETSKDSVTKSPESASSTNAATRSKPGAAQAVSESLSDEADTAEVVVKKWRAQLKSTFSSMNERKGVDLSANAPTMELGAKLSHDVGAYISFAGIERLSNPALYQQSTLTAGYEWEMNDNVALSADLSLFRYPNDSVNALAGSPAAVSLCADIAGKSVDYSISFDHYFGNPIANYLTLGISHTFGFGEDEDFSIIPAFSLGYSSTKYKLKKLNKDATLRGLSAATLDVYFNYRLGMGFSLSADPTLLVSFQKDLLKVLKGNLNATSKVTQFLIVVGLRYSYAF